MNSPVPQRRESGAAIRNRRQGRYWLGRAPAPPGQHRHLLLAARDRDCGSKWVRRPAGDFGRVLGSKTPVRVRSERSGDVQQNRRCERVGDVGTTTASTEDPASGTFEVIYRMHYPAMMRLGFLLTGSNEVAEDLVHDVFLRARGHLPLNHPASYLRAAVVNACRSHHRRTALARRHAPQPTPLVMPRELVEFRDVLLGLPIRQRAAVVLRYYCDLSDAQIAGLLDCRPATVRSLVQRGLANLREVVNENYS